MNLTKSQKKMLALFLAVVALVIVLWISGVFKSSFGFRNNNRSRFQFGRVNNRSRFQFGRVNNRSRFGALGAPDNTGPVRFDISYTNPPSFGKITSANSAVWNGLVLSVSTQPSGSDALSSTVDTDVVGVALADSNPFYTYRYKSALMNYYGGNYKPSGDYTPNNADYIAFEDLGNNAKLALKSVLPTVLSSKLDVVDVNEITFDAGFKLTPDEIGILRVEIKRLIAFIATFRTSPTFDPNTPTINKYSDSKLATIFSAFEGVYVGVGATIGTKRGSVTLATVKQTGWLNYNVGDSLNFGVGIINSNLSFNTPDRLKFPFMVSDMIQSTTTVAAIPTTVSDSPTDLTVSTTFW